jgi:hypothetical protein
VEAALAGSLPVVSSIPVHREVLAGVEEAVFLDPLSELAWQEAFLRVAAEPRASISARSKQWIRETWSVAQLAETMDGVYRACLGL